MGKGSSNSGAGAPQQSSINTYDTSVPTYAQPYVNNMLGAVQGQLYNTDASGQATGLKAYQPYSTNPSDYFAPFSPLQQQAQQNAANMQVAPQLGQAADYTNQAAQGALGTVGQAQNYANQGIAGAQYNADLSNMYGAQGQASGLQGQQLGIEGGGEYGSMGAGYGQQGANIGTAGGAYYGGQGMGYGAQGAGLAGTNLGIGALGTQQGLSYGQNAQNPYAVQSYMNPYLQASLAPAQQLLNQQYGMQGAAEQGAATSAGAFGGSREALMQGLNQQNANLASNQLVSNAYNQAYNTANQNMQAASQLGMQGANVGLQGLQGANTAYGTGIAGANTGLQGVNTQLAGTAQGMQGAQVGLQGVDRQLAGTAQGMQGAQIGLQGAQQAGNLDIAGAQLGLSGVGAQQAGYGLAGQQGQNLANIGQTQYGQQMGINNLQNQVGAQQTAAQQAIINQAVQNYTNQQQYPYMQLGFANNMLRGLPMSSQTVSNYVGVPNPYTQAISGIGTLATAPGLFSNSQQTNAEGGLLETKKMASGGITQAYDVGGAVRADLYQMSPQELKQYMQESSSPEAKRMAQEILSEKMPQRMVSGGIAAVKRYAEGTPENEAGVSESGGDKNSDTPEIRREAALNALNQGMPLDYNQYKGEPISKSDYYRQRDLAEAAIKRNIPLPVSQESVSARQSVYGLPPKVTPTATPVATPPAPVATQQGITAVPIPTAPVVNPTASTIGPGGIPLNVGTSPVVPQTTQTTPAAEPTITQTAPAATQTVPTAVQTNAGILGAPYNLGAQTRQQYQELIGEPLKTFAEQLKEREDYLGPNTAAKNERMRIMAERTNQADEKERLMQIRRAQFFANLGTKTGPTIMAAAAAMKETLPSLIEDQKEQRKQRQELDRAMTQLEMSERAEKAGNYDAAQTARDKAIGHMVNVNKSVVDLRKQELENQGRAAVAGMQEHRADKRFDIEQKKIDERRKADEAKAAAQEKKLYIDKYAATERERITAANNWAKIKNSDDYKFTEQTANMPNPNKDPKKQSVIDQAKQKLEDYRREYKAPVDALETSRIWYGTQAGILKENKNPEGVVDLNKFLPK
jgi:hypothetical protein